MHFWIQKSSKNFSITLETMVVWATYSWFWHHLYWNKLGKMLKLYWIYLMKYYKRSESCQNHAIILNYLIWTALHSNVIICEILYTSSSVSLQFYLSQVTSWNSPIFDNLPAGFMTLYCLYGIKKNYLF